MQISKLVLVIALSGLTIQQGPRCIQRCDFEGEYVCANNTTYPSRCHARCDGNRNRDIEDGRCVRQCDCRDEFEPVCGLNGVTYNSECEARCLGVDINENVAGPCECNCLPILQPVCGNNQVTYLNVCVAGCYNIGVLYLRPCEEFPSIQRYPRLPPLLNINEIQRPFNFVEDRFAQQIFQ